MIQILPIMPVGIANKDEFCLSPRMPENLLVGNIGRNIKQLTVELMSHRIEHVLRNLDTALEQASGTFDVLESYYSSIREQKIQFLLEQKYGPVLASNFGLTMNTMMAFFRLMESKLNNIVMSDITIDPDLITHAMGSKIMASYAHDSELQYPSEILVETDPTLHKMIQSIVFTCNMGSFITLVMLTMFLVRYEDEINAAQIAQMEQLLRDWTLDILIQVDESLDTELDVSEPLSIAVPVHEEDSALAEMGLDDYLKKLE